MQYIIFIIGILLIWISVRKVQSSFTSRFFKMTKDIEDLESKVSNLGVNEKSIQLLKSSNEQLINEVKVLRNEIEELRVTSNGDLINEIGPYR